MLLAVWYADIIWGAAPHPGRAIALHLAKNSLRSFFCARSPAFGGHIFRLQYQYAEKPHESYIMRLNLCVKAANYYKQTLAMEDYNNGI